MNLFVGNLNQSTEEEHLKETFSEFGSIKSVKIIMDAATGTSKGFGFVEMEDRFQAYDAIDNLDQTYFMGNIITVKEAKNNKQGGSHNQRGGFGKQNPRRQFGNSQYASSHKNPRRNNYAQDN